MNKRPLMHICTRVERHIYYKLNRVVKASKKTVSEFLREAIDEKIKELPEFNEFNNNIK